MVAPVVLSACAVAPLLFLEVRNNVTSRRGADYVVLFGLLWVVSLAVGLTARRVARAVREGDLRYGTLVRMTVLVVLVGVWFSIVNDQMPCFLGTPNCD